MNLTTLFWKLQEHNMELKWLVEGEKDDKKKKSLALKVEGKDFDVDEDMILLV